MNSRGEQNDKKKVLVDDTAIDAPIKLVHRSDEEQQSSQTENSSVLIHDSNETDGTSETDLGTASETGSTRTNGTSTETDLAKVSEAGSTRTNGTSTETDLAITSEIGSTEAEVAGTGNIAVSKSSGDVFDAESVNYLLANIKSCLSWFWSLRAPLFLLGAIAISPKFVLLWIFIVLAKPIAFWIYKHFPMSWKARLSLSIPESIKDSTFFRDISEGADQGLPFILFWMYLFCLPFSLSWMAVHWVRDWIQPKANANGRGDVFVFTQNKKRTVWNSEANFYHSRSFAIVMLLFFALGIPEFISYSLYEKLGVAQSVESKPMNPVVMWSSSPPVIPPPRPDAKGLVSRVRGPIDLKRITPKAPSGADATVVLGYNGFWPYLRNLGLEPTKFSVFFVHFYLASLGSALCIPFFRAWFLFPLNFISDEHDVEVTESGIKRNLFNGWFLSVLTINRWAIGGGPDSLRWSEVRSLRRMEEGFFKLCPLPETAFKKESLSYKLLNKLAAFIDGISNRPNAGNFLIFSSTETGSDFGKNIKINLNDLNQEQRARLFYFVKKSAPHAVIHEGVEEQLLGSTVLKDNRYTQIWFDILTARSRVKKQNVLAPGETLKNGAYKIEDRISSGGQATTYLATKASGEKCVLKEFILSTSTNSGALIDSSRDFEAEVSLLSQLSHPGIVKLEDFFADDTRLYVALEHIPGQSLRQKVQQEGALSEREVVRIAQSVSDVLDYLHGCNPPIVHRDITPENILIDTYGNIKLIDFSLAVKQDGRQTTDSCAKQAFTPPEQFREEVCVQSDIYALGATMFFLLTGLTPKPISSSSPKSKAPNVSDALNKVVERSTELDLNKRYESVHWLKLDLSTINPAETPPAVPVETRFSRHVPYRKKVSSKPSGKLKKSDKWKTFKNPR